MPLPKITLLCALVLWVGGVGLGIWELDRYDNTPGPGAAAPARWPASAPFALPAGRSTLLVFVHPQCPCSRASIAELARIVTENAARVEAAVFFFAPSSEAHTWTETDLWRSAKRIGGVRVLADVDGRVAQSFGALTSGQVLLYNAQGHLTFRGGITPSRGESGDNAGRYAIERLLRGAQAPLPGSKVFGCSLRS